MKAAKSEPSPRKLLVVEDDAAQLMALFHRLSRSGFTVDQASDGAQGAELAATGDHDLVVLDVMLPGKHGFEIVSEVRGRGLNTPILMLSARGEVANKVAGLHLGADDYLTKPFEFIELLARIEALLRRADHRLTPRTASVVEFGDVHVDFRSAEVRRAGELVQLPAKELDLLRYLVDHAGAVLSRDELLDGAWAHNAMPSMRTVDVHIARLRLKLESVPADPKFILTVRGRGYKFAVVE